MTSLKDYKNKHQGQTCYIIGAGPTAKKFREIEPATYISVNTSFFENELFKEKIDYMCLENTPDFEHKGREKCLEQLSKNVTILTTTRVVGTKHNVVNLSIKDITDELKYNGKYNGTTSVVFYCLNFALYAGFKHIYLVGCDCSSGKAYNSVRFAHYTALIRGWQWVKDKILPQYPDVRVTVVNPVGLTMFDSINVE